MCRAELEELKSGGDIHVSYENNRMEDFCKVCIYTLYCGNGLFGKCQAAPFGCERGNFVFFFSRNLESSSFGHSHGKEGSHRENWLRWSSALTLRANPMGLVSRSLSYSIYISR